MKVTIKDVAKKAGVSVATVSRVLNKTANVNLIKKLKVEEAIEELGFKPNSIARSLTKKNSNTIGLIVPSIVNPFFNEVAAAVEQRASENGYTTILCNTNNSREKEKRYFDILIQNQVDAFVVISDNKVEQNIRVPIVYLDRYGTDREKHSIIRSNHYEGGRIAGEHLIEKGCRKIAYIGKEKLHEGKNERIDGFIDALNKHKLEPILIYSKYHFNSGLKAAGELFESNNEIDGIFAGNDLIAYAVFKEAYRRNISIPEDIQLVGYDDIMFSELKTPGLTTIAQPIENLGKLAVDVIIEILNNKKNINKDIILPVKLIKRGTTN